MRKGRDGEKKWKIITIIVATNVIASQPPERRRTGTPHAHAKIMAFLVATKSLPAVDRLNADRWNAARSCQLALFSSCIYIQIIL